MGLVFGLSFIMFPFFPVVAFREENKLDRKHESFRKSMGLILKDETFRRMLGYYYLIWATIGIIMANMMYYFKYVLQMEGQFRPPYRDPDAVISLGERADHMPPQKARSSENRDQRVLIRCHGPISWGQIRSIAGVFNGFAIRQHVRAVQWIWVTVRQFDKRATDPY